MASKSIFKFLMTAIFVIVILNCAYADSGPSIGANQAKDIAQDYLNSHNLPYKAVTPGWDAWKFKVKDTKTGGIKWITANEYKSDFSDYGGQNRYREVGGDANTPPSGSEAWVVQVNDKNGKNVGRIYVDAENGKILKPIIDQGSSKKESSTTNTANSTNITNATPQTPSGSSGNNTGIIFGIFLLICAIGAGYFMYTKI